ncbi:MAG: DUF1552 domain-containing protein [Polyangiaceae bacterium]
MSRIKGLPRRTVLRGLVGGSAVALALPMLEAMLNPNGDRLVNGAELPVRFISWFWGNGKKSDKWNPDTEGPDYELKEQLQPLANVKDYVSVLTNFSNKAGYGRRGHHDGVAGFFSGHPFIELDPMGANYASKFGGPSIDQVIADVIDAKSPTYLKSMQVAVSKRVTRSEGPTLEFISHRGPDQPLEQKFNPQEVYDQLFGNFTPMEDPSGDLRLLMLDAVNEDAKQLRSRLGAADKLRLDAHLEGIAQLQKQLAAMPPTCTPPGVPGETNEDVGGNEPLTEVARAMSDLIVVAFQCDLTRVVSFQHNGSVGGTVFHMTGTSTNMHSLSHDEPADQAHVNGAIVECMSNFGYLLEGLMNASEGSENLLAQSVVLCGSDCQEGVNHSSFDQPALVAGGGGGALTHPGIHYRSTTQENTSDILLACLQVFDPSATEVGSAQGLSTTPLLALKA